MSYITFETLVLIISPKLSKIGSCQYHIGTIRGALDILIQCTKSAVDKQDNKSIRTHQHGLLGASLQVPHADGVVPRGCAHFIVSHPQRGRDALVMPAQRHQWHLTQGATHTFVSTQLNQFVKTTFID